MATIASVTHLTLEINVIYVSKTFLVSRNNIDKVKSRLSLIVRVNIVLNRTVVVDSDRRFSITCAVVIFRVKVSCITSVDGIILWLLV